MVVRQAIINNIKKEYSDCKRCELYKNRKIVVFGTGNKDAKLIMVGEAPGRNEDNGGKPFIGAAGKLQDKIFEAVGIKRDDIWITNTCLCRPKNNRTPNIKEINSCNDRLVDEILCINPNVVVVTGNTPLFALTGKRRITSNRGIHIPKDDRLKDIKIYATFHPAALIYDPSKKEDAWEDWKKIKQLVLEN